MKASCQTGSAWQKINRVIRAGLAEISLADLGHPPKEFPLLALDRIVGDKEAADAGGRPAPLTDGGN